MKRILLFSILLSSSAFAELFCRDLSTPDNSAYFINFKSYQLDVTQHQGETFGAINLYSQDKQSGALSRLNISLVKLVKISTGRGFDLINQDKNETLHFIYREGKVYHERVYTIRSTSPLFNSASYRQLMECTEDQGDLELLQYGDPIQI